MQGWLRGKPADDGGDAVAAFLTSIQGEERCCAAHQDERHEQCRKSRVEVSVGARGEKRRQEDA
jgi:hypothetical protein